MSLECLRGALLFLPASNPRMIDKARNSKADLVVLDLEDAVKPADKAIAREQAVEAVAGDWPMPVVIRVNGSGTDWHEPDIDAVAQSAVRMVVVPRVEDRNELDRVGRLTGKPVLAMIETAKGVLGAPLIAQRAVALIAGTNDLAAGLRLPPDAGRRPLTASLQLIVLAARAAGIAVFDGVFNRLDDPEGFTVECREGRQMGFDGKSLIHPDQIAPCRAAFAASPEEVARARRLVAAASGGAERFEGAMIERMHVEAAQRLLDQ